MAKFIRAQVGAPPIVPAPVSSPLAGAGAQQPYNLITSGPYGTVYSTSTALVTADGAVIPAYHPVYSVTTPVPVGRGRA